MMGRELKRVPLDFNWPLNIIWKGYCNPYASRRCEVCEGYGINSETLKLYRSDSQKYDEWISSLTQEEINYLQHETYAFLELTHEWKEKWIEKDPKVVVDKEMIIQWDDDIGKLHSYMFRILKFRAERLGIYGDCPICSGEGEIYFNDEILDRINHRYDRERYDPPKGDGWQIWEIVSEGSPISPVFATAEACIEWLVELGYHRTGAEQFVLKDQLVPSMVVTSDGKIFTDIDCCLIKE